MQNNKGFKDDEMYDGGENEEAANEDEGNDAEQEDGRIPVLESLEDFENSLKNDGPVCIVFTDRSNTVCTNLYQQIEALQDEFSSTTFFRVDIIENKEAAIESEIENLPTFKCFRKGFELEKVEGDMLDRAK